MVNFFHLIIDLFMELLKQQLSLYCEPLLYNNTITALNVYASFATPCESLIRLNPKRVLRVCVIVDCHTQINVRKNTKKVRTKYAQVASVVTKRSSKIQRFEMNKRCIKARSLTGLLLKFGFRHSRAKLKVTVGSKMSKSVYMHYSEQVK